MIFQGGVIETHITCNFQGKGGSGPPVPPSGSALGVYFCFELTLWYSFLAILTQFGPILSGCFPTIDRNKEHTVNP